jgi:uncharacterized membrane protein
MIAALIQSSFLAGVFFIIISFFLSTLIYLRIKSGVYGSNGVDLYFKKSPFAFSIQIFIDTIVTIAIFALSIYLLSRPDLFKEEAERSNPDHNHSSQP